MRGAFEGLPFADACVDGLLAITDRTARAKIRLPDKKAAGYSLASVDIDTRMRTAHPNANRWDYGVYHGSSRKRIEFVEVHPAESGEVEVVIRKQRWLKDLMTGRALPPHSWHWIPSGKISILPRSSYLRRLDEAGIKLVRDCIQL